MDGGQSRARRALGFMREKGKERAVWVEGGGRNFFLLCPAVEEEVPPLLTGVQEERERGEEGRSKSS